MVSTLHAYPTSHSCPAPPAEEWVFLPPTVNPPPSATSPTPSHLPTPFSDAEPEAEIASGAYAPIQLFAAEYFTTALAMPFEVGRTLLQIEYRPRRKFAPLDDVVEAEKTWPTDEEVRKMWTTSCADNS